MMLLLKLIVTSFEVLEAVTIKILLFLGVAHYILFNGKLIFPSASSGSLLTFRP
jgi:hypothetical protein